MISAVPLLSPFLLLLLIPAVSTLRVSVFGASGGVGQQICSSLSRAGCKTTAISRNIDKLSEFPLLEGCDRCSADARDPSTLFAAVSGADHIIISVGTTAFPTNKWKGGNDPKTACYDTVENILTAIGKSRKKPKKVVLLSSIGVERCNQFPFKILNLYGILDQKRRSEVLLLERAAALGFQPIICRPGRLVGAPFTNNDLAKLFQIDQGQNKGIIIDTRDALAGDIERRDVAESITRLLLANTSKAKGGITYAMVNKAGPAPTDQGWSELLSLLSSSSGTVGTTRES